MSVTAFWTAPNCTCMVIVVPSSADAAGDAVHAGADVVVGRGVVGAGGAEAVADVAEGVVEAGGGVVPARLQLVEAGGGRRLPPAHERLEPLEQVGELGGDLAVDLGDVAAGGL